MNTFIKKGLLHDFEFFRYKLIETYPITKVTDKDVEALLLAVDDKLREIEDLVSDWEDFEE